MSPEELLSNYFYWQQRAEDALLAAEYANSQLNRICQELGETGLRLVQEGQCE